jgi:hypothetical protein
MSDIMRGAAASAGGPVSATERALEARFASVRIAALQDEFSTYATDLIRLRAEIISKHFSPEQIVKQSNILNTPDGQDQQLIQQAVELIKNSQELVWRVQVRPESVAMVDFAALKQERTEYLMAVSQFLQSSGPLIETEPASAPMLMEMLKWGLAGFKGSQDIEGVIDRAMEQMAQKLAQPQEQQPDPEAQKMQMQMQLEQTKSQAAMQLEQAKNQGAMQLEQQGLQIDMQRIQAELQAKIQEKQADIQQDITKEKAQLEANTTEEQFETEQFMIRETHKADEAIRVELAKTQLAKSKDID